MTAEEISKLYGYSVDSIKSNFTRTALSIRKKFGVDLIKCKGIDGVFYQISSPRAITMYKQIKDQLYVPIETIKMDDLACFVLIGVAATPQGIFRGTCKDFLDYIGLSCSKKNIELLNQVLNKFVQLGQESPLCYEEDKDVIIVYIRRQFEKKQILTINMLRECQDIAHKYNKQAMKVVQLLKVWQAYRINQQKGVNPLTDKNLQEYVDLSQKQIRDVKKLLQSEGIININGVYSQHRRIGTEFSTNGIIDNKNTVIEE